jgi:hypothetical protein
MLYYYRSPSPTPVYDNMGRRVNTREQRAKDKLMAERQRLVERAKVLNPLYRPPLDYRPFSTKKIRKIYVPVKDYPDYNFIGLILGPRGMTQRQMEQDTGAKISLRGKGSVRDGKGRSATKDNNEDEDLHVVIAGDSEESLDHAESLVRRLLVPVEEGKNDIKRKQLRKLAEMNGTLRDNAYGFEREERAKRAGLDVYCKWCGESSHPSSDCNQRGRSANGAATSGGPSLKAVTREYYELMQSLGEDVSGMVVQGAGGDGGDDHFTEFLASVGVQSSDSDGFQPNGGAPTGRYGGNDGRRGGGYGSGYVKFKEGYSQQQTPSSAVDDIPPWERMEQHHDQRGPPLPAAGAPSASADAPAPWDL